MNSIMGTRSSYQGFFQGGAGGSIGPPLNERLNETLFVCACLYILLPRCNLIVSVQYRYKFTPVLYNTGVKYNTQQVNTGVNDACIAQ